MNGQEKMLAQKRGRPATGKGLTVGVRLQPDALDALDGWRLLQPDAPGRPEAIRRLLAERLGKPLL